MSSHLRNFIDVTRLNKPIGFGIIGPGAKPEHIEERLLPYAENAVLALSEMLSNSF